MNLQRNFSKAALLSFILSLLIVFLLYSFTVNRTIEREYKAQLSNAMNLHALSVDFTIQSFVTDIQSLGSRTIIRKALHEYNQESLSLEELIEFTQPKYADGAAVIRNIQCVRRYLIQGAVISQYGNQRTLRISDLSTPGVFLTENGQNTLLVIEPIVLANDTIGFDAGVFNIDFIFREIHEGITSFRLVSANKLRGEDEEEYLTVFLPTQPFVLQATLDKDLLKKRKTRSLLTVLGYSLVILFVIALIFYFTQFRLVKKIIAQLTSSEFLLNITQKIAKAGGWQYNSQTRETRWTLETYLIFDLEPQDTPSPAPEKIMKALNCFTKKDRLQLVQSIRKCTREEKIFDLEFSISTFTGTPKWVRIVLHPLKTDKKTTSLAGTIMDISKQKHAAIEHIEKQDLEKKMALTEDSLRFKQNFLANMSHELRTPLNGIVGMSEVLKMTSLSGDQQEYLSIMGESAQQLEEMVDRILNFSRIEAGNIELNKEKFSLGGFTSKLKRYFFGICQKAIQLKVAIKPGTPENIVADETRMFEVAANLVSNAVKFTHEGKIIITIEATEFIPASRGVIIKIVVSDTGIGIKENIREGLFEPFYKLEESDTRDFEGSGLGLAMSQRLVRMHGGKMDFLGLPGRGSSVWFTFLAQMAD